ncbi:MAG: prephenate dehydrogenase/arogenate dehydrogenase family protein [Verrucomicrobia bacterium]|nr:prephenate dehydrogenase/arogenate dehydrogenase family protein [Verrucomicrobiota bacterium]
MRGRFCVVRAVSRLQQLTILAPGLLGGSVARAAHTRGVAKKIVLWARRPESRLKLQEQPWCQGVADSPEEAVRDAQLVVLAPPVDRIVPLLQQVAPALHAGAIVTDVGSVKADIARLGDGALGKRAHFVGSHPMAGSEKTGWEHGSATLFENRTCFVTPTESSDPRAVETVVRFWRDLGAEVVSLGADQHDEIVAHISHLPQVIASTLCAFLATKNHAWRNHAGGGLRDTTRIASSDSHLWRSILEQNRDEVLRALRQFQEELHGFQIALANRDYVEIAARLERGKAYRDQFRPPPA